MENNTDLLMGDDMWNDDGLWDREWGDCSLRDDEEEEKERMEKEREEKAREEKEREEKERVRGLG